MNYKKSSQNIKSMYTTEHKLWKSYPIVMDGRGGGGELCAVERKFGAGGRYVIPQVILDRITMVIQYSSPPMHYRCQKYKWHCMHAILWIYKLLKAINLNYTTPNVSHEHEWAKPPLTAKKKTLKN